MLEADDIEKKVEDDAAGAAGAWKRPPKPVRTEEDWKNIALLAKLRECPDEEKPEGLPLACIVKVIEYSEVPMAREQYAMVGVYGPDDRVWKMCVMRGTVQLGDEMLFVSEDAALPLDERWNDRLVCPMKQRVYKYGFGIKVRRQLPIVRRNIYANNCGVLFPPDDFAKELRNVRLGEDCASRLNIESATEMKMRQNDKKRKPLLPDEAEMAPAIKKARQLKRQARKPATKASYNFLGSVRWMRKGGNGVAKPLN